MNTKAERDALKRAYRSRKWTMRVNKMSDAQVIAIYRRLKLQDKVK